MHPKSSGTGRYLITGAAHGAIPWIAYGVVEVLFLVVVKYLTTATYDFVPYRADFALLVLGIYAAGGALAGLILGVLTLRWSRAKDPTPMYRVIRLVSTISLIAVCWIAPLEYWHHWFSPQILGYFVPLAAAIVGLKHKGENSPVRAVSGPWTVAFLLLTQAYVLQDRFLNSGRASKFGMMLLSCGAILAIAMTCGAVKRWWTAPVRTPGFARAEFVRVTVIALIACSLCLVFRPGVLTATPASTPPAAAAPDVIMITMDTVRADHLSVYGYERETTPNLAAFAAHATLYRQAVSNGDMTLSSHGSMFTSAYPSEHGAHFDKTAPWGQALNRKYKTLAETLSSNGFQTMGVVANMGYLTDKFGLDRGFARFDQRFPAAGLVLLQEKYFLREELRRILEQFLPAGELFRPYRRGDEITRAAIQSIDLRSTARPFFLFMNYMDAHYPYIPPGPFDQMFPGKDRSFADAHYDALKGAIFKRQRQIEDLERRHLISQYDGGIAYADHQLGKFFAWLRTAGIYDRALILVTADHGESFGERDLIEHGVGVYQSQIHVPLIIKYPHQLEPAIVDTPVSGIDVMPTVLDVAGLNVPKEAQGVSLHRLTSSLARSIVSESYPGGPPFFGDARFNRIERSYLAWPLKLISSTAGKRELYDLQADPVEKKNLYGGEDPASQALEESLRQWTKNTGSATPAKTVLGKDALRALQSLGYIQ